MKISKQIAFRSRTTTQLEMLSLNVTSVALAIEAFEQLLIEKGVLKDNELMEKLSDLAKSKVQNG